MEVKVITDLTATNVISLANLRNYLEFTETDATEDTLITSMLKSAVRLCEQYTGEAFGEKTIEVLIPHSDLDENWRIDLPFAPFGVMANGYPYTVDVEGTEGDAMTLNTDYYLNGLNKKNIKFMTLSTLIGVEEFNGWYKCRYTCGYGISGVTETIPEPYIQAMMEQVRNWYERKEDYTPVLDYQVMRILDIVSENGVI